MNSPALNGNGGYDDEMEVQKNAALIMATNNSSIVSKRSVERLYLPEPHFYRYFVKKPIRRAPTINRGYWLRMRAVEWVIRQFLEKPSHQRKVVINLGCGYDPVPFQWLSYDSHLCMNTKFVDVDYEPLMETKREVIVNTPKMRDLLRPFRDDFRGTDPSVPIDSEEYAAIGCDLRNLRRLERLLRTVFDVDNCLILCVAEVSITYMDTDAADALIAWSSRLSRDVSFCLLEQCLPDRPDHPFAVTMMKHFAKLGTPLQSVLTYPYHHAQVMRFSDAGFTHIDFQNLWELWANPDFMSPSQRLALNHVEPFDEWEEFALFASHYCLVVAHNRELSDFVEHRRSRRDSDVSLGSDISARTASPYNPEKEYFAYRYCNDVGNLCQRHHGSSYPVPDQDSIVVHGGVGPKARLATSAVVRQRNIEAATPVVMPAEVGSRCCHTITALNDGTNLLVGGRASPTQPKKDCWWQKGEVWTRVHDLPEPRYRHRVLPVHLPDGVAGAILFGGKTDASNVAADTLLWDPKHGWKVLRSLKSDPIPRFGPNFIRLGYNHGLLFGGMRQDGVVCQGLWRWRLVIRDNTLIGISFRTSTALDATVGSYPWFARFGASYTLVRDEIIIIGGIAKAGCIPHVYELASLLGSFSNFSDTETEMSLKMFCVMPARDPSCPRPLLVGHSTHRTKSGMSIIMGGGATCFSFGNFFNKGVWILHEREQGLAADWHIIPSRPAMIVDRTHVVDSNRPTLQDSCDLIKCIQINQLADSTEFPWAARSGRPNILKNLDFGPCTRLWSLAYLRNKTSPERTVVIHESASRIMNFHRKDFNYTTTTFHEFLEKLSHASTHLYLRSLATKRDPTKSPCILDDDWSEIASEFHIPLELASIVPHIHSSPFRISNDISMWLHYDVMANVLFQVRGVKKLILFPPEDLDKLSFAPGATTSSIDIFNDPKSSKEYPLNTPPGTKPHVAILQPGDALFIPPMWAHTGVSLPDSMLLGPLSSEATPSQSSDSGSSITHAYDTNSTHNPYLNIAVNVFFRNLPANKYAAGRDVYGNRDLAAYEEGRRDLEKITRRFVADDKSQANHVEGNGGPSAEGIVLDAIPHDVRKAYLMRLGRELIKKAEEL